MVLHRDTLRARFQALGPSGLDLYPITLDKGSQDVMVSRDFMAAKYGGSMQATCPDIGKRLKEMHGMDDFMYLHPAYQPVAPQVPGACGLFFTTGSSIGMDWNEVQRVFTRIDSNVWQYMGMYRLTSSPSLTRREWEDQEPKVKQRFFFSIYIEIAVIYSKLSSLTGAKNLGKGNLQAKLGIGCPCTSVCSEKTWTRANSRGVGRLVRRRGPTAFGYIG